MSTGRLLDLAEYRYLIDLDRPFEPAAPPAAADGLDHLARGVLNGLSADEAFSRLGLSARWAGSAGDVHDDRRLLRALLTVRGPGPLPLDVEATLDALLAGERLRRPAVDPGRLPTVASQIPGTRYPAAPTSVLWRGDITTLAADAIVNAANGALLGCFQPMHTCIDNAIHSAAGPRLRNDCQTIISAQGGPEPPGTAKVTRGYHVPARYVLHTVGPIVDGPLRPRHEHTLASAYRSCLNLAAAVDNIRTLAFCSIGTGVFGFPKRPAAQLALKTVAEWVDGHPGRFDRVVINVYGKEDHEVYLGALSQWTEPW